MSRGPSTTPPPRDRDQDRDQDALWAVGRLPLASLGRRLSDGNAAVWVVHRPLGRLVLKRLEGWTSLASFPDDAAERLLAGLVGRGPEVVVPPMPIGGRYRLRAPGGRVFMLFRFVHGTPALPFREWRDDARAFVGFHAALRRDLAAPPDDVRRGLLSGKVHRDLGLRLAEDRWAPVAALLGPERAARCRVLTDEAMPMRPAELEVLAHTDVVDRNVGHRRGGRPYLIDLDEVALSPLYLDPITSGLWAGMNVDGLTEGLDGLARVLDRPPRRADIAHALQHLLARAAGEAASGAGDASRLERLARGHNERVDRLLSIASRRGLA